MIHFQYQSVAQQRCRACARTDCDLFRWSTLRCDLRAARASEIAAASARNKSSGDLGLITRKTFPFIARAEPYFNVPRLTEIVKVCPLIARNAPERTDDSLERSSCLVRV